MTVSTKNKKSVLRALEGSGVKWLSGKDFKESNHNEKYVSFNFFNRNELTQSSCELETISAPEFVGHVWREMVKDKEVQPGERIEKKDLLDLPPVIGQEYDWNGKKVVFVSDGNGAYIICDNSVGRNSEGFAYLELTGKTARQYLADYDI